MSPYKIPTDIYETVLDAMLGMTNATDADDDALHAALYERLREFCEQQTAAGRGSGFMWEALADVSTGAAQCLAYYERSLELARDNGEPIHTALLEMGRLHAESGDWSQAEPLLIAARDQAIAARDPETETEATASLQLMPSPR
jgi:hypothetical protein